MKDKCRAYIRQLQGLRAGDRAWSAQCLPGMHGILDLVLNMYKTGVVVYKKD